MFREVDKIGPEPMPNRQPGDHGHCQGNRNPRYRGISGRIRFSLGSYPGTSSENNTQEDFRVGRGGRHHLLTAASRGHVSGVPCSPGSPYFCTWKESLLRLSWESRKATCFRGLEANAETL